MKSMIEDVLEAFAGYPFGPPCTQDELDEAEWTLGHPLPEVLRDLYTSFDGFSGPTSAVFFYPLIRPRPFSDVTLVEQTLRLRFDDNFGNFFRHAVLFGDYGCGTSWGIRLDAPDQIFQWNPSDGEPHEIVGFDPLTDWLDQKQRYDALA
ncbi:SMI1/KNR4 family protein [Tundrisphaera lichenicola]|uniref:SMI1/KNR4 family protein n=1 Tax=Tundrisphaera lichenicola TaxID=2029860 RepID=UPI003EB879A3